MPPHFRQPLGLDNGEYESSSDSEDTARDHTKLRPQPHFIHSPSQPVDSHSHFLTMPLGRSSTPSTASSTPLPSRSNSPLPQLYPSHQSSSCPSESDSDSEPTSPPLLLDIINRDAWWRESRRPWWATSTRRRRKKGWRIVRFLKRWLRRLVRHPFFPSQPITIVRLSYFSSNALTILNRSLHSFCFLSLLFLLHCFSSTFSIRIRILYLGERIVLYHHLLPHLTGPLQPPCLTSIPISLMERQLHLFHLPISIFCHLLDYSLGYSQSILLLNVECL